MTRKNKGKSKTYWLYGKHAVQAALVNSNREVHQLLVTKNAANDFNSSKATIVDPHEIDKHIPDGSVHQGVAANVSYLPDSDLDDISRVKIVLILDQVTDPHNTGAILRSCAAFGAGGVIVQEKNSPQESGVMAKSASGALESIPIIRVTNLSKSMEELKEMNFWCVGLDGDAKDHISKIHDYDKVALVLGAEGKGLRRLVAENCDLLVKVPINDGMESLNVSNAAAVALYELTR